MSQRQESYSHLAAQLVPRDDADNAAAAQTMHLHIGADLQIPVRENKYVHPSREEQEQAASRRYLAL